jgi:hypothetical protein
MAHVLHSNGQERLNYLREMAQDAATLKQLTETASRQSMQLLAKSSDVSSPKVVPFLLTLRDTKKAQLGHLSEEERDALLLSPATKLPIDRTNLCVGGERWLRRQPQGGVWK